MEHDMKEILGVVLALCTEKEQENFFKANSILGRTKRKRIRKKQAKKMERILFWFFK